jgi:methionyl-tRNA synthetase
VINPGEIVAEYGTDALRYFLLREISSFDDSPFTMELFKEAYNANLANGIGNLTSRIMKMAEAHLDVVPPEILITYHSYLKALDAFDLQKAMDDIWGTIALIDRSIQEKEPFRLVKINKQEAVEVIRELVIKLNDVATLLEPLLPETSQKIKECIKANKMPEAPLFIRK